MGTFHEEIPENIYQWILLQKMLWVATAPLAKSGHINVSPKGGEYFGLLDNKTFWYMDLSGSGSETIAHLRRILERESLEFNEFVSRNNVTVIPASRSIIIVDIHQVGSSCGYSVPFYEFKTHRKTLNQVFEKRQSNFEKGKKEESMDRYWAYKNAWSIDGLPGMQRGLETGAKEKVEPIHKMIGPYAPAAPFGPKSFKASAQLRHQLAKLDSTRVQLKSVLLAVVLAFLVGFAVAAYAPAIIKLQRGRFARLLM